MKVLLIVLGALVVSGLGWCLWWVFGLLLLHDFLPLRISWPVAAALVAPCLMVVVWAWARERDQRNRIAQQRRHLGCPLDADSVDATRRA